MWLRVRTGEDAGREVALEPGRALVLGRERGCDVVIRCPRASRRHAEVRALAGGRLEVRDLGSSNGTWADDKRVGEAVLADGEELRLGDVRLAVAASAMAPTYSMVGRLVEAPTLHSNRFVGAAAGLAAVAAAGVAAFLLGPGAQVGASQSVPQVVARSAPVTVLVETLRGGARSGMGSGWVLDAEQGLVVTSNHVINQGDVARIAADGRRRAARVIAASPCDDVALLQVADSSGLRTAALRDGPAVRQGETVVALGYPAGADPRVALTSTAGVVSVARTAYRDGAPDLPALTDALQTDTALNPGNSGGPLLDLDGRLVGMNAAVRSAGEDGRALQNQNYAISVDRVRAVVARLRGGAALPGWTGLTFAYPTPAQLAARRLPSGLLVTGAVAGSPAARAGLGATSDVLAGVDGRPVGTTLRSFCAATAAAAAAAPRTLAFARAGSGRLREVALSPLRR